MQILCSSSIQGVNSDLKYHLLFMHHLMVGYCVDSSYKRIDRFDVVAAAETMLSKDYRCIIRLWFK